MDAGKKRVDLMTRGLQHLGSCFEGMKSKLCSGLTVEKGSCFH